MKYLSSYDIIDLEVRVSFPIRSVNPYMLKYAYGFNQHTLRDSIMNHKLVNEECLRCSRKEDWNYMMQYPHTLELKVDFIMELQIKLL